MKNLIKGWNKSLKIPPLKNLILELGNQEHKEDEIEL
jgi:hypothetical protein